MSPDALTLRSKSLAPSNIALVKYWGKRDVALNIPATGSISVTLDGLSTTTTVDFRPGRERDECTIDGERDGPGAARVVKFLDLIRSTHAVDARALIESSSNFPAGAGLASSASGFAALAVACDAALGLNLSPAELSVLARRGSGSAARSLVGGFAEMRVGESSDGTDSHAVALAAPDSLDLTVFVAVTTREPKAVGSTEGMLRTAETSPYYEAWTQATTRTLDEMRAAILAADVERVGALAEANAMHMHATMLGAQPPLLYWNGATVETVRAIQALRSSGACAFVTIDAGPQVKVLCDSASRDGVRATLDEVQGVLEVIESRPGPGARLLEAR